MSTSIIVPVYNEEPYLEVAVVNFLTHMPADIVVDEILLVENGSTDRTLEVCRRLSDRYPGLVKNIHLDRPSYGDALRVGLLNGTGTILAILDSDFLNHAFLEAGLEQIDAGADLVVGSKGHPGAADERPWRRRFFSRIFRIALGFATGYAGSDTRGMKIMRREISELAIRKARTSGDAMQTEVVVLAWKAGYRIHEVPLRIHETRPSRNSPVAQLMRAATGLVSLTALYRLGSRD